MYDESHHIMRINIILILILNPFIINILVNKKFHVKGLYIKCEIVFEKHHSQDGQRDCLIFSMEHKNGYRTIRPRIIRPKKWKNKIENT